MGASDPTPPVLILHVAESALEPIYSDIRAALGEIPADLFDAAQPLAAQFADRRVVVDIGGWARAEHLIAGRQAGVELWQVVGYGLDHLDLQTLREQGLTLARAPGSTTAIPLAEHAMFLLLAVAKNLHPSQDALAAQHFFDGMNRELVGATLLIVGLGASGRELARRARGFQMRVIAVDVLDVPAEQCAEIGVERCLPLSRLPEALAQADVVSLHLPLDESTVHTIDATALAAMPPGGILINVARGRLVDEQALIAALRSGHLAGAGLDVFEDEPLALDSPLRTLPTVVCTPHWAAATRGMMRRRAEVTAENVRRVLAGEPAAHVVS